MPFDLGWNARSDEAFVTDQAFAVFLNVESHVYPHTFTNANGYSVNAGWDPSAVDEADRVNTNDPRIAGINYLASGTRIFRVDLGSGSAPGAGDYTVDCAFGDASFGNKQAFTIRDDATVLINGTNGGAGFTTASGHFIDATLTDITASTTWTGTAVAKTFATTTVKLVLNPDDIGLGGGAVTLAHFRLTLVVPPITGVLAQTLGVVTLAATGVLALAGTAAPTVGAVTLAATGTLALTGQLATTLEPVTLVATGSVANTGTLAATLGPVTLVATATMAQPPPGAWVPTLTADEIMLIAYRHTDRDPGWAAPRPPRPLEDAVARVEGPDPGPWPYPPDPFWERA